MPHPLDARLLYASRVAYHITIAGTLIPPPDPAYGLTVIDAWTRGLGHIDAALIARADEGIILAFRGTVPTSLLDWLNDADAILVPGRHLPGLVHQGFYNSLIDLWPKLEATLVAQAKLGGTVYVTGHSKGGAIAYLAGLRCQQVLADNGLSNPVVVHTFAAARPGDVNFANGFNTAIADGLRYEYAEDIVPHLPPGGTFQAELEARLPALRLSATFRAMSIGFVPAGVLNYYPRGSTDTTPPTLDSPGLETRRLDRILRLIVELNFSQIAGDHSIKKHSGYADVVTGGT